MLKPFMFPRGTTKCDILAHIASGNRAGGTADEIWPPIGPFYMGVSDTFGKIEESALTKGVM